MFSKSKECYTWKDTLNNKGANTMTNSNVDSTLLKRLQARAAQESCSVDELLARWLDAPPPHQDAAYYPLLAENTHDIIYRYRLPPEESCEYISPAVTDITGYTPEEHYADPYLGYKLIHPDDRHIIQKATQQPSDDPIVLRWVRKDGAVIWMEQKNTLIFDDTGTPVAIEGIARDITEREQALADVRKTSEQLQTIIDHIPVMIAFFDESGRFQFVNRYWVERLGWTAEELQQYDDPLALFYPDPDYRRQALDYMLAAEPGWRDFQTLTKSGEVIETTWANVRLSDGRSIGIGQDISERKQMEKALRESEKRYKLLSDLTFEGIVIHQEGVVWDANPAFLAMFGYDRDELIGQQVIDKLFTPESRHCIRENIQKEHAHAYEVEGIRKDGTRFPIETEARQITPERRVASLRDITERKQNEAFALENERLKASFKKEQEQNALIQQIIAMLSHDLRTPLTIIQSSKDILSRYADQITEAQRQEKLEGIGRQLQFALELLEDTVLVARGNLGEKEFRPAPVNLAALCQVSVNEIRTAKRDHNRLRFVNLDNVGVVSVDEILVSRILLNLLSNAIKYSPDDSEIRLELGCQGGWVMLRVVDQGMGMTEDDLPHIFEPFYRPEHVQHIQGTGLGLSIVKDCVERHRGRVHVESQLGQGTTFTIELPTPEQTC